MANKQSAYDSLLSKTAGKEDLGDAFNMIIHNPYRILGASTFCEKEQLEQLYTEWEAAPEDYKPKFDKSKLGAPVRTSEEMQWALENADNYVYKLFWFSDADIAVNLGNKSEFIEFFSKSRDVNNTDYNSFLAQYIFLCIYDRNFTMTEQWGIILNLINSLLNVSVGRFWAFFSGNKIEAIDNNRMAFLYNQFKDNILFPIRDIVNKNNGKIEMEEIIHIHSVLNLVEKPQLPFSRIQNLLYEKMERWFVKESEYVNNVLLANVTSVNATSMEEKLAITSAYNYIMGNILPEFRRIVENIIPADHSMNTRLRMMFSGKFIVVSKILSNTGLYNESLKLCQVFNELFEDDYISGEIETLNTLIQQDEKTRMAPHTVGSSMGNPAMDEGSGLAHPAELGELEELQKTRRNQFFKRPVKKVLDYKDVIQEEFLKRTPGIGIDYKEVIQGVLDNELKLVSEDEEKEKIPYVERMVEENEAEAEAEAVRLKTVMEQMQREHELELNSKIEALNAEYRQSMKKLMKAMVIIIVVAITITGISVVQMLRSNDSDGSKSSTAVNSDEAVSLQTQIKALDSELDYMESTLSELSAQIAEISSLYDQTGDAAYAEQFTQKQNEYNELRANYDEKVSLYNQMRDEYKAMTE